MKFRIIMSVRTVFSSRQWSRGRERNTTWAQEQTPSNLFTSARPYLGRNRGARTSNPERAARTERKRLSYYRRRKKSARFRRKTPLITRISEAVVFDSLYSIVDSGTRPENSRLRLISATWINCALITRRIRVDQNWFSRHLPITIYSTHRFDKLAIYRNQLDNPFYKFVYDLFLPGLLHWLRDALHSS